MQYLYDWGELEVERALQDAVLGGPDQHQRPLALAQRAHRPKLLRHLQQQHVSCRSDGTYAADWALKTNYLSIYLMQAEDRQTDR